MTVADLWRVKKNHSVQDILIFPQWKRRGSKTWTFFHDRVVDWFCWVQGLLLVPTTDSVLWQWMKTSLWMWQTIKTQLWFTTRVLK